MAKSSKKMAIGGQFVDEMPNAADPKYQDPAYITEGRANANRINSIMENARNRGTAPDLSGFGVSPLPAADRFINSPVRGAYVPNTPDFAGSQQASIDRGGIDNNGFTAARRGGKISKKPKGKDWHGFGLDGKTGKINHGF